MWKLAAGAYALASMGAPLRAFAEDARGNDAGLRIETGSPDALCPELESTRSAVRRRLGELVVPSGSGFVARYTIGHAPAGSPRDFVRLELRGAGGALLLARDLPLDGESCSTMAEVIALVLDRHFRALLAGDPVWPEAVSIGAGSLGAGSLGAGSLGEESIGAGSMSPEPSVPEKPWLEPANSGLPTAPAPAEPARAQAASPEPAPFAVSIAPASPARLDELALDLAFRQLERPALGVRATFELSPHVYLGTALHLSLSPEREALPDGGEVTSRDAVWRAYAAWGPTWGALRTYGGPGIRVSVARGAGRGLPRDGAGVRASWALGADVGVIWSMHDAWTLHLSGALDVMLSELGGRFYVEGSEVLKPATLQGWLGIGAGYDL